MVTFEASGELSALLRKDVNVERSAARIRSRKMAQAMLAEISRLAATSEDLVQYNATVAVVDHDGVFVCQLALAYLLVCVPDAIRRSRGGRGFE